MTPAFTDWGGVAAGAGPILLCGGPEPAARPHRAAPAARQPHLPLHRQDGPARPGVNSQHLIWTGRLSAAAAAAARQGVKSCGAGECCAAEGAGCHACQWCVVLCAAKLCGRCLVARLPWEVAGAWWMHTRSHALIASMRTDCIRSVHVMVRAQVCDELHELCLQKHFVEFKPLSAAQCAL